MKINDEMVRRIPTNGSVVGADGTNTSTYIGAKETFLDRNAKLIPSDESTTAITNMNWIAGHHTVNTLENLYKIPDFILSQECYADKVGNGADALGQLWYVEHENCLYMLVNWKQRRNSDGWSKTNIKSLKDPSGKSQMQYINNNSHQYDNLSEITVDGAGNFTYTAWTQGFNYTNTASTVTLSYTHHTGSDSSINIPVLNDGTTIKHTSASNGSGNSTKAGIITADQYNSLIDRLKKLEEEVVWRSRLGVNGTNVLNGTTYLWTGTLSQFNSLNSKPADTTFIITN